MEILEYSPLHPKIILFGEYTILLGADALTLPLKSFSAQLDFIDNTTDYEAALDSNLKLKEFAAFLSRIKALNYVLNIDALTNDLTDGLYLQSNVPFGYGLGSSGLVCAAIFRTYKTHKKNIFDTNQEYRNLLEYFSIMESYFHVKSSGIDPLACYLGEPLLVSRENVKTIPHIEFQEGSWFLLDSGIKRNTGELVQKFNNNIANNLFREELESHYISITNELINRVLYSKSNELTDWATTRPTHLLMENLSLLQIRYFHEMIPYSLIPVWQHGIDTGSYYLKLLGAGGGGYFLGYTQRPHITEKICNSYDFTVKFLEL
jgi:mevalonate kinase